MGWKTPSILSLLLLAAAAPSDCTPGPAGGRMLPAPLDLTGRPNLSAGLSGQTVPAPPSSDGVNGCHSPLSAVSQSPASGGEPGDALHGLPAPDLLQPIEEPKLMPQVQ
jgi:hypothetical protein